MKSKELIRQLQELDPSGEIEVYGYTGAILCAELKPGYWDGACLYFDKSKEFPDKLYISDKLKLKILINEVDLEEFIFDVGGNLDRVVLDVRDPESWKKKCEEYAKEVREIKEQLDNEMFKRLMQKIIIDKFEIVCFDKTRVDKFHEQYFYKDGKEIGKLCQGECEIILKSEFFKQIEESDYIKYILK